MLWRYHKKKCCHKNQITIGRFPSYCPTLNEIIKIEILITYLRRTIIWKRSLWFKVSWTAQPQSGVPYVSSLLCGLWEKGGDCERTVRSDPDVTKRIVVLYSTACLCCSEARSVSPLSVTALRMTPPLNTPANNNRYWIWVCFYKLFVFLILTEIMMVLHSHNFSPIG